MMKNYSVARLLAVLALFICFSSYSQVAAQESTLQAAATGAVGIKPVGAEGQGPGQDAALKTADPLYRIGAGDVLNITVVKHPELSRELLRVDNTGSIRMPRIEGDIRAACRTEQELAGEIKSRLTFLRSAYVEVAVKDYNSQPVAVLGAVNSPGRFQLQRPVRLLELLTFVNGPSGSAGQKVNIIHAPDSMRCEEDSAERTEGEGFVSFRLEETLRATDSANPVLRPGDIVRIPEADEVYLIGNVRNPQKIALKVPITLSQAVAMCGGVLPDSNAEKIRITRQTDGAQGRTELVVDLKAINKRQQEDLALLPNDIIEVPGATGIKRAMQGIAKTLLPGLSMLPIRVIP
jgi:polysaccharide export outer membrane protein